MDRLDKFLTNWKWTVIILGLLSVYFFTGIGIGISLPLIVILSIAILIVTFSIQSNKIVRGKIHWRSGEITYTGYYDRYSEFEEWKSQTLISHGHLIYTIDEEEKQQVSDRKV